MIPETVHQFIIKMEPEDEQFYGISDVGQFTNNATIQRNKVLVKIILGHAKM